MNVTITVNLEASEYDLAYEVDTVQEAVDQAAERLPAWTSMVVVFTNPAVIAKAKSGA